MEDVISRRAREALGDTGRRCTATNRAGEQCRRAPIPGGFVCSNHGGKIPAVQRTARERLMAMVDPALNALLRALRTAPACPHCGRSDADRDPVVIRAAQLVLDRTGFGPNATITHEIMNPVERIERVIVTDASSTPDAWRAHATADELAIVDGIIESAKLRAPIQLPPYD